MPWRGVTFTARGTCAEGGAAARLSMLESPSFGSGRPGAGWGLRGMGRGALCCGVTCGRLSRDGLSEVLLQCIGTAWVPDVSSLPIFSCSFGERFMLYY